ncbi:peptide deformylase [Parasphingopyxis lamellibrachiae]|uniref:Peptide deformylase n=1 Tax=Parasphingopyxis lamellibrachiae TaxID=680125 RepID=A0A3D9FDC1_9SPHN|nr:peptide deformylase [Parasphingopyxis lamellibrachiae]RED15658.1 peptide deformylase [Parasphingopyxis lamellibrachiae]
MAILPIVEVPDPRLKTVSTPVEEVTDETRTLIADMFDTMYDAPGIGLAAIQVGVPKRILVIDLQEPAEHDHEHGEDCDHEHEVIRDPRVFINPEILDPSDSMRLYEEGCLSVPDQFADVERPDSVTARWLDENGKQHEERIEGMLATCLQHEMDHLEGILFIDHLSRLKRQMVLKKLEKSRKLKAA